MLRAAPAAGKYAVTRAHTHTGLPRYLHWCVLSTPEIQKCGDMAVAFSRQALRPEIQCVSAESPQHCMEQIQVGAVTRGAERDLRASGGSAWDGPYLPSPCLTELPGEEEVSCDNSTGKGEEEGPTGTCHPTPGSRQRGAASLGDHRDSSSLSGLWLGVGV